MKLNYTNVGKAVALSLFLFASNEVKSQNYKLQLLHYADADGNENSALDSVDEFSALVNHFQTQEDYVNNTLTVTSGDIIIPGPRFYAAENSAVRALTGSNEPGHLDIAFANAFKVDAACIGNHELDQGTGEFFDAAFKSESKNGVTFPGSKFPWLSSNIDFSGDDDFVDIIGTDGDEVENLKSKVAKYSVITINEEKIGIVGAASPSFPNITSTGNLLVTPTTEATISNLASEIQTSVDALEDAEVNKIVLLSHMQDIAVEKELAELLNGVDIIVAGGSNTRMGDSNDTLFSNSLQTDTEFDEAYPFQTTGSDDNPVLVVNVDGDYKYLGRLVVEFDNNGIIDTTKLDNTVNGAYPANESLITTLGATRNSTIVSLRDAAKGVIDAQFNNVVGYSSVYLDGRRSKVRTEETNLGNLTADANLWYANLLNPSDDAGVDVSLKNGGGLRTEIGSAIIPKGSVDANDIIYSAPSENKVTEGHLRATLRFDNGLVRLSMTGVELANIIEHSLNGVAPGSTPGSFPQLAGMKLEYDPTKEVGNRITNLIVTRGDSDDSNDVVIVNNGEVTEDSEIFNMVTLNFLANGGDGYPFDELDSPNRLNYYEGTGYGEDTDYPDGDLSNDPENNSTFSYTGGEQDALAEYMSSFYSDNDSAFAVAETDSDSDDRIKIKAIDLSVNRVNNENTLKLFPNPVNGNQNITISSSSVIDTVEIISIEGKLLFKEKVNSSTIEIPTENISKGIFFVKTSFNNGNSNIIKGIK